MPRSNIVYVLLITALLSMTYLPASAMTATTVNLAASANVDAIAKDGSPVGSGGMDGKGYAYSETLLGATATWSGVKFSFGTADALDAASASTVSLPAGRFSTLYLLATGVKGNQPNQTFHVTYTDGSTTTFTQSFSDWYTPQGYAGESKALTEAYRLTGGGGMDNRTFYMYGYAFAINGAKTVQSVTLPNNRDVVVLALSVSAAAASSPSTNMKITSANVGAIANNGMVAPYGGLDGLGNAYSASLLSPTAIWSGVTFTLGQADTVDAISRSSLGLPSGRYGGLYLLATGVNGNQPNQAFQVNYTDGTSTTVTQSLSDWHTPQNYAGESVAFTEAYRVTGDGGIDRRTFYVYGYSFAINGAKTVQSVTLPNNRDVVILAAAVSSGGPATAPPLAISGAPGTAAVVGKFYSFTPTVVAPAGWSLTYSVSNQPNWAQFSAKTGALSGTPGSGNVATDAGIVVSVSTGSQTASLPAFSIAVTSGTGTGSTGGGAGSTGGGTGSTGGGTGSTGAGTATLSWTVPTLNTNGTPLTNLAGYIVRYGTNSAALTSQISVGSPSTSELQIGNLSPGVWYFAIAAVNTASVTSPLTPTVGATIQ